MLFSSNYESCQAVAKIEYDARKISFKIFLILTLLESKGSVVFGVATTSLPF